MKKNYFILLLLLLLASSCIKGKKVDFIFHNTTIHSCNESNDTYQAMSIKNGLIVESGPERQILNKYRSNEDEDLGSNYIYPTLIDANLLLFNILFERFSIQTDQIDNENHFIYLVERKLEESKTPIININSKKFSVEKIIQLINEKFTKQQFYILNQQSLIRLIDKRTTLCTQQEKEKVLSIVLKTNFYKFKSLFLDIQNELIEHGFNDIIIHDCNKNEYLFLKQLCNQLKINTYLYINFNEKILSTNKIKIAGYYLNEENKKNINHFIIKNKPLSFSSTFYQKNSTEIKKQIPTINQDHRWICIANSKLTQKESDELNEYNIYPIINSSSSKNIVTNFLSCYGSGITKPFEMELKYLKQKNLQKIQLLKSLFTNGQKIVFQDNKLGILEKNKPANFIVLKNKIDEVNSLEQLYIERLYIKNKLIYKID